MLEWNRARLICSFDLNFYIFFLIFRFVKYCGYRSGENQCEEIFPELASHVKHLIENHGVPVYLEAEGHFMIKYDRDEFKNTDDEEVDGERIN